jgi:hypothetical protein
VSPQLPLLRTQCFRAALHSLCRVPRRTSTKVRLRSAGLSRCCAARRSGRRGGPACMARRAAARLARAAPARLPAVATAGSARAAAARLSRGASLGFARYCYSVLHAPPRRAGLRSDARTFARARPYFTQCSQASSVRTPAGCAAAAPAALAGRGRVSLPRVALRPPPHASAPRSVRGAGHARACRGAAAAAPRRWGRSSRARPADHAGRRDYCRRLRSPPAPPNSPDRAPISFTRARAAPAPRPPARRG